MIRRVVRRILPNKFRAIMRTFINIYKVIINYSYDAYRYIRYSSALTMSGENRFNKLEARIMAHIHSIERGFSLKNTKMNFGRSVINSLISLLYQYVRYGYSTENGIFLSAISVLETYVSFHKCNNQNVDWLEQEIVKLKGYVKIQSPLYKCGYFVFCKDEILGASKQDFATFSGSRFSIRDFSEQEVDIEIIKSAVRIAQKAPSACNKQPARVILISNKDIQREVLSLSNGVRGMENSINKLLIITVDLSTLFSIDERNQAYIDGGIFLSSLLYALHYFGLGACPINWSVEKVKDIKLRKLLGNYLKPWENIIAFVAVGNLPEKVKVAVSLRKDLNEVVTVI
jgi:nitroreductase